MTVHKFTQPDFATQTGSSYKGNIDKAIAVLARLGGAFAPRENDVGSPAPDLSMIVDAGALTSTTGITEVAAQTVSGFTIPASGYTRIDRVVVDASTGAASRVAGTAATGSPSAVAPDVPAGSFSVCQITFTDTSTALTNSMITDEREALRAYTAANFAAFFTSLAAEAAPTPASDYVLALVGGVLKKCLISVVGAGGVTTIESGSLPAAATEDVSSIAATYSMIVAILSGASSNTATRFPLIQVDTDNGASFDTTAGNYEGIVITTDALTPAASTLASLIEGTAVAATQTFEATAILLNYQGGGGRMLYLSAHRESSGRQGICVGIYNGSTSAINAIRFLWNGSGNFDAGTYAVLGVK